MGRAVGSDVLRAIVTGDRREFMESFDTFLLSHFDPTPETYYSLFEEYEDTLIAKYTQERTIGTTTQRRWRIMRETLVDFTAAAKEHMEATTRAVEMLAGTMKAYMRQPMEQKLKLSNKLRRMLRLEELEEQKL